MADKLSAETVCSNDSTSGFAPSVVASGSDGVELALRLDETRDVDRTPPVETLLDGGDVITTGRPEKKTSSKFPSYLWRHENRENLAI